MDRFDGVSAVSGQMREEEEEEDQEVREINAEKVFIFPQRYEESISYNERDSLTTGLWVMLYKGEVDCIAIKMFSY